MMRPKPRQVGQAPRGELKLKSEEVGWRRGDQVVSNSVSLNFGSETWQRPLPRRRAFSKASVRRDLLREVTLMRS